MTALDRLQAQLTWIRFSQPAKPFRAGTPLTAALILGTTALVAARAGDPIVNTRVMRNPVDVLAEGSTLLAPTLGSLGYVLAETTHGKGSGGPLAIGRWVAAERSIETHVRTGLGIVEYGWGRLKITHQDYLLVRDVKGAYPGFSDDPIDGFRHLAADLAGPVRPLLMCDQAEFATLVETVAALPTRRILP